MNVLIPDVCIKSISNCLPAKTVNLSAYFDRYGEREVNRISAATGIESVHLATSTQRASDLCEAAAREMILKLQIDTESIDAIIFVSQTPDHKMPATSCSLQDRLGLKRGVVAFDINYGCSGYIYGLLQAAILINSRCAKRVLVCVGDTITKHLNPDDHKVNLVFGDAGSATLVEPGDDVWAFDLNTDGSGYNNLIINKDHVGRDEYLHMDGSAIMEFALREVPGTIFSVLKQKKWLLNEISAVCFHQANKFMIDYLRKKMELPKDKVPIYVRDVGNTGPCSIPLTLCEKYTQHHHLDKMVLCGFGVGLSWGSVALSLSETIFLPTIRLNE